MEWEVEYTDEFSSWWDGLSEAEQVDVNAKVILLQKIGPALPRPHADLIHSSRHPNMKELRIQHSGGPIECSLPSTRGAVRSCWSGATRLEMIAGMKNLFRWRMLCTTSIFKP
jgi:hypothetical protein